MQLLQSIIDINFIFVYNKTSKSANERLNFSNIALNDTFLQDIAQIRYCFNTLKTTFVNLTLHGQSEVKITVTQRLK